MAQLHILLADDDTDEMYLFNEALEHAQLDIRLSKAHDGNQLLQFLSNRPLPDIVFMDINMPYKDGVEALTEIRSRPEFDELPLVIYSTTKSWSSIDACYAKGANLFIIKPNNFDGMVKVLKQVCTIDWKNRHSTAKDNFVISEDI